MSINPRRILLITACCAIALAAVRIALYVYGVKVGRTSDSDRAAAVGMANYIGGEELESLPAELEYQPFAAEPEPFPSIVDIPIELAEKLDGAAGVHDQELVLGVVVGGEARAYPVNQMTGPTREIFNDVLGDEPIAATW